MKKLFFIIGLLFVTVFTFAIVVEQEKTYEYDISECEKSVKVAKLWTTEHYENSKDAIQFYDEDLNLLTLDSHILIWVTPLNYTLKIQIKGDKLLVKFNNFSCGKAKLKINNTTAGLGTLYETCDDLAESLYEYYKEF